MRRRISRVYGFVRLEKVLCRRIDNAVLFDAARMEVVKFVSLFAVYESWAAHLS